jgi:hypothetical protein
MRNQFARFTGGTSTMTILLHTGKRGTHNLKASVRTPGEKTTTGMRSSHTDEADAVAQFRALCVDAVKQGWTAKTTSRATFSEMPAPPTATPTATVKPAKTKAAK